MIPALLAKEWKNVVLEYIDTVFPIREDRVRRAWLHFLQDPQMGLFKGMYLQARLPYRVAENPEANPLTAVRPSFPPFAHQMEAFRRLNSAQAGGPKPTLVTTGTGSGKTESFLYPVVDHCVRMKRQGKPGIKAILLYPMNALAQDQAKRLAELIDTHSETKGVITAGLYVGQGGAGAGKGDVSTRMSRERLIEDRKVLRKHPPDILLTNYKMLDRLLQRKVDVSLWAGNDPETLQYLVLDEFHAYDGVQLADLACLIRRLLSRLRMEPGSLCPVATSATLGDGSEQALAELRQLAHTVYGQPFDEESVVRETRPALEKFLEPMVEVPLPEAGEAMRHRPREEAEAYIRRQVRLWFGEELGGRELGDRLRSHPWLELLCRKATQAPLSWAELVDAFQKEQSKGEKGKWEETELRLYSFLAVLSHAKVDERRPLLPVQVQLWTREMRGLVRGIGEEPNFRWSDQGVVQVPLEAGEAVPAGEKGKEYLTSPGQAALPMGVCYACGVSGWISVQSEEDPCLWTDPKEISGVYGRSSHNATPEEQKQMLRFVYPASCGRPMEGSYREQYLTTRGATLEKKAGPDRIRVYVVSPFSIFKKNQCPYCGERDSVLLVSMRRASISSVLVAHTIGSAHTSDRKILTFVDSVQDSAHLAGFIRHRTQSSLLRTGIRQMLEQYDGAPLDRLLAEWQPFWRRRLGDEGYLKAFVEKDDEEERLAGRFPRHLTKWTPETWEEAQAYVSWRVVKELGLHARLGRSLYLTGSAALGVSEEKLTQAARLAAESIREHQISLDRDGQLEERVRALMMGTLHRMMLNGGISHPLLDRFREEGGNRHFLKEQINPLYEGSRRTPRFFTNAKVRRDGLDSLRAGKESWIHQYLVRSLETPLQEQAFQLEHAPDKEYIAVRLFQGMQEAGLVDVRAFDNYDTYGLNPRALEIHKETVRIRCRKCQQELTVPRSERDQYVQQVPCITHECPGNYQVVPEAERSYYDRVYKESRLEPVVSKEHSGLVDHRHRKEMERRFADKKAEQPINVLVCTPTMEMGIDIGDLSTVLLSDVPPGIANRVQRVGRAGRSTGTALISQLFRDSPHDQYFWQTPRELLQGRVETPVCRLDAPEVLKRHLRAYLLDCWIRDHPLAEIPATVSRLLSDAAMNGFPPLWFAFAEQNREGLWKKFSSLVEGDLRRDSLEKVKDFFFSGAWKEEIEALLRQREQEIRAAQLHLRRINERLKQPALQGGEGEADSERKELYRVRAQARRHLKALTGENTLEWWTVEGLLPNYTFPDREVILRRFLPRAGEELETEEFARAPEMALRDFAPGNIFYARGHASAVNQIPMVSREVEKWRFCPECHHMERAEEQVAGACPRCGNAVWQDQGQVHSMVRLTHVMSRVRAAEDVLIRDQQDERERQPTEILPFFHFPDDPLISCGVKGQVFGFEFFESALMREINFGPKNEEQTRRTVANQSVPLKGFTICTKCGAAAEKNHQGTWSIRHVRGFGCDRNSRRTDVVQQMTAVGTNEERVNNAGYEQGIYLYRELKSEALRVLLPVSDALCKERVATWEAVLRLGLREKIGGSERQIGVAAYDEPIWEQNRTLRARYLVLYDRIPGGTGYLRQLADEREFQDLLGKAFAKIRNCSCQHDGSKDGCYRCLFRYESQHAHQYISRRRALEMVEPLLEKKVNWERKDRLRVQEMDARRLLMESDLEAVAEEQLIKGLEERLTHSILSVETYQRGDRQGLELTWPLNQGRAGWRMIRQVTLSGEEGVPFTTRADWVLEPIFEAGTGYDNEEIKPVVFYCDGAEFHIGEGEFYRLSNDILIREGLRRGNKYAVFSVTWRDLKETESSPFGNMAAEMDPEEVFVERLRQVADVTGGAVDPVKMWRSSSLDLLVEYLVDPRRERWVELAKQVSYAAADVFHKKEHAAPLSSVVKGLDACLVAEAKVTYLPDRRFRSPKEKPMVFREFHFGPGLFLTLLVTTRPKKVLMDSYTEGVLRLEDTRREDSDSMVKEQFQSAWHAFHHWFNILQWLETFRFVTGESLASKPDEWALLEQMYPVDGLKTKLQAAKKEPIEPKSKVDLTWVEYVHSTYRSMAAGLAKEGVPVPEVGYEFMKEDRIVAEAELAWPEYKLCVLRKPQRIDASAIQKQGWRIWDLSIYENEKDEPVRPEGTGWKELWQAELERRM